MGSVYCESADTKCAKHSGTTMEYFHLVDVYITVERVTPICICITPLLLLWCHVTVTNSRAKPQQTPSVEKHARPPRVVYCAIYPTLSRFTKSRV